MNNTMDAMSESPTQTWTGTLDRFLQGYADIMSAAAVGLDGKSRAWCVVMANVVADRNINEQAHSLVHDGNLQDVIVFCDRQGIDSTEFITEVAEMSFIQKLACMEAAQHYRAARSMGKNPEIEEMFADLRDVLSGKAKEESE